VRPSPFKRYADAFGARWDAISPELQQEILADIAAGKPPAIAVKVVFERHGIKEKIADWIAEGCLESAAAGGVKFASDLTGRFYFLNKTFNADSISLSERVTQLKFQDTVVSTLQANLASQDQFSRLVTDLAKYTTEEDLPQGLLELERQARRVMSGDVEAFDEFAATLKKEKAIALSAIHDGDETVLKRSYVKLTKAAESLNEKSLNYAVENAIDQKARSAAFRIAHTEMANAYGLAVRTDAARDTECTGIEWTLSSAENHCDVCDDLDGKVFALGELPEYPAHPHCSCHLDKYYGDESDVENKPGNSDDETIPEELLLESGD
jgi:hypothetical protein